MAVVTVFSERPRRTAEVLAPGVVSLHLDAWSPGRGPNERLTKGERIAAPARTRNLIGTYLLALPRPTLPVFVLVVVASSGVRDADNLQTAPKHVFDAVKAWLGTDDRTGPTWSALTTQVIASAKSTHVYIMERERLAPIDDAWWPVSPHAGWQYASLSGVSWPAAMARLADLGDLDMHEDVPQRDDRFAATRSDAPGFVFRVTRDRAWPPRPMWIEAVHRGEVTDLAVSSPSKPRR